MRNWFWLLISAAAVAQAGPPQRVELAFDVLRNGASVAQLEQQLQHDGRIYQLTENWSGKGFYALLGNARRTSRGMVAEDGLQPLEFTDERTGRSTASASFDWRAHTVTRRYRGEPRTEALPSDAHDRLAFLFDFAFSPPPAGQVSFELMDGRGQSRHVYSVDGTERLKTPAGEFDTLRLVRRTRGELAEIWLAIERSYLPIRVRVSEKDGTRYDQVLVKISTP